ncbi:LysR family transcriptional regulator [Epidermidibacterium keratini]|uniref:LysR family transcriptional regulator n=1 Tax=Epidermidibacterium keratini TaxID=1891644 RepID=A0A7L4YQ51_9ACTN|nr:LysR family transcriptional regulator [Epidermidibacterium keratini]QHC01198.1 LysR family transcriptional regulator [Epidermidibacterium keratini]
MELHQLRYFVAVVDEGTFTAAAEAVHISQSGVSAQLQKLERELGVELIDRTGRRIGLTAAGERLLPYARSALAAINDVTSAADDIRGLVTGSLRVGTVTSLTWPTLFDALAAIHSDHPGVDLHLQEGTSDDLITRVRDGSLDVAVAAWSVEPPDGVQSSLVFDDPLVAVVASDHAWADQKSVRPSTLARADLIALSPGTGARAALEALLRRVSSDAQPRWEVSSPAYVQLLASRGLGVGILSQTTAGGLHHVRSVAIADAQARSQLGIVWSHRPSHAARVLVARLMGDLDRPR